MIPRILHFVWVGAPMPIRIKSNLLTFYCCNPTFGHNFWDEVSIGTSLGLDLAELWQKFLTPAGVSNVVRLVALAKFGGLYFDTDFFCRKPLDSLLENEAVAAFQDDGRICNAFMGATPGHPWIQWQLDCMGGWTGHGAEWGVYNATNAPRDGLTIIPQETVYPYLHNTPAAERTLKPGTLAEHLWEGSWI